MTSPLQERLRWLAEAAGYETRLIKNQWHYVDVYAQLYIPGASGHLSDAECSVVESWLVEAGFDVHKYKRPPRPRHTVVLRKWRKVEEEVNSHGFADTLSAALEAALLALEIPEEGN